ncbi:MAG TPA: YraN family protein [Polyangiaceae bacterium]|nr:YraN family protein [Polyangiaceae bacterium]
MAEYLTGLGWEICGRNVRVGRYELDLVAIDGKTAVIVEVRTRGLTAWTTAIGSIDAGKRERMRSAANRIWRDWFRRRSDVDHLRFDVAAVRYDANGAPTIEHIRAAFA